MDKIYKEILSESHELQLLDRSYKFGVASVVASLHKWCDYLKKEGTNSVTPEQVKYAFLDWVSYDMEINLLFNRLLDAEKSE